MSAPARTNLPNRPDTATIWAWLEGVPDPEIPVISVVDLGIIRGVSYEGDTAVIAVTPTYSGCPATAVIELSIETHLAACGLEDIRIERRISPPWTSDWMTAAGREKLADYGIAPPIDGTASGGLAAARAARLSGATGPAVGCPRCKSVNTERVSQYGSTPCKAAYRCRDCLEPFDYFKCI